MKFTLEIELGNDAMQTGYDVACALNGAALSVTSTSPVETTETRYIRDANGNAVGTWQVEDVTMTPVRRYMHDKLHCRMSEDEGEGDWVLYSDYRNLAARFAEVSR
jgi:hypothetical protein